MIKKAILIKTANLIEAEDWKRGPLRGRSGPDRREEETTMKRIKIKDLPKDAKITKEEMRRVLGGIAIPSPTLSPDPHKIESSILFKV